MRDRPSDIPFLLRAFLADLLGEEAASTALAGLPPAVLSHPFPGNVRELRNLAERYAALRGAGAGWAEAFAGSRTAPIKTAAAPRSSRLEREEILAALASCGYHRGRAAEKLGVTRRALQYRLAGMRDLAMAAA